MIAEDINTIVSFINAMRDPDRNNQLFVNAENTDYMVYILSDIRDRVRMIECQAIPASLRDTTGGSTAVALADYSGDNVVNLAAHRANNANKRNVK